MDQSISLNKFISDTGYCSRREADKLITSGRVLLNNRPASLGNRYKPGDTVEVDGSLITAAKKDKCVYLALNKPPGITTTTELHIKDNIISFVNYPKRIFPIGRLDKDSEGLIFLTNDGDIINKILRAANNHEKEYIVKVDKAIDTAFLDQMSKGVPILDTRTLPCKVQMMGRQTFRITLTQGLNRQIRRMCEYLGYEVVGLQRVRIMNVKLDKLPLGKWRHLTETELAALNESIADSSKVSVKAFIPDKQKEEKPWRRENEREKPGQTGKSKPAGGEKFWSKRRKDKPAGGGKYGSKPEKDKPASGEKYPSPLVKGKPSSTGEMLAAPGKSKPSSAGKKPAAPGKSKPSSAGKKPAAPVKGKPSSIGKKPAAPVKGKPSSIGKKPAAPVKSKPSSTGKNTTTGKGKPANGPKRTEKQGNKRGRR